MNLPPHAFHFFSLPSPTPLASSRWHSKTVGLLGGSFNPPHEGHMHIARAALRRYKFHAIWWMVSPQNPLKSKRNTFKSRYRMTRCFVKGQPKMLATDIETRLDVQYSYQTVVRLQKYFPKTRFTWIAGMDNASIFHKWDHWRDLIRRIPFIFFNRPPNSMGIRNNSLRMLRGRKDIRFTLTGKTRNISSTALRKNKISHFIKTRLY